MLNDHTKIAYWMHVAGWPALAIDSSASLALFLTALLAMWYGYHKDQES